MEKSLINPIVFCRPLKLPSAAVTRKLPGMPGVGELPRILKSRPVAVPIELMVPVAMFTGTKSPVIDKSPTMRAAWADGADAHISATTATNKLIRFNIRNLLFNPRPEPSPFGRTGPRNQSVQDRRVPRRNGTRSLTSYGPIVLPAGYQAVHREEVDQKATFGTETPGCPVNDCRKL